MEPSPSLRELFDQSVALPPPLRASFLDDHCADPALRAKVEDLLAADGIGDDSLFGGGAEAAARSIGDPDFEQTLPPGTHIGPFELIAVIGEGGSSTVFHAMRQFEGVREDVALKLLRRGLYTPDAQKQFRRERQALAQLQHSGIARLIEGGVTDNGLAYIALELVDGKPLTDYAREHRLDLRERLMLFQQICRAVEAAHRALIVHRDLKPSNVLVTNEGQIKLLDFGIAKLLDNDDELQTRIAAFTPAYAAPEQRSGAPITTATDVYALGILLGELVTGQRLTGDSARTPSSQIGENSDPGVLPASPTITRRSLRGDLDNIVLKAIDVLPEHRYVSAGALADDIQRLADGRPVAAHPPSRMYRTRKFIQRHRGGVTATVLFALALATAFGIAIWQAKVARDAALDAEREAKRATATKNFLVRVFQASDPRIAQDTPRGKVTAKELLDLNAPRIKGEFANDPDTQIELLGVAASIYRELDDTPRYDEFHKQQTDLARERYGDAHPAIIVGLLDDADHANDRNDYAQALKFLTQADPLIHRAGLDRSALRARWFMLRSDVLANDDDDAKVAAAALDSAVKLYAEVAPQDSGNVKALTTLGYRAQREGGGPASEPWFRRAIAAAETASDRDDSELQHLTYPGLASALESQGKYEDAEVAYQRSVELARKTYGESHSTYWVPAAEFASLVHRQGERDRSHALFDELFRAIPNQWNIDSYDDYAREFYAACLIAEGRSADAIPLLEAAMQTYIAKPSVEYELRRVRLILGDAYDHVGRTNEARTLLKSSLDERIAKDPPDAGTIRAARERWGRFLFAQHDSAGAEEQFRAVIAQERGRKLATFALAHGDMAMIYLERSDIAHAVEESRTAVQIFADVTGRRDVRSGPALWLIHAHVLRRSGNPKDAREWAQRALDASRNYDAPAAASIEQAQAELKAAMEAPAA
jgi:eukaryotic-like serine/threonine-protein kinase